MTDKYRDYAFDPRDLYHYINIAGAGEILFDLILLSIEASKPFNDVELTDYIQRWKKGYALLSNTIKIVKYDEVGLSMSEKQYALTSLRRLANTMLNARQYALDSYRGRRDRERKAIELIG